MILLICAALAVILITVLTEKGEGWWSFLTLAGFVAIMYLIERNTFHNTWDYIKENTGILIVYAIIYIIVGIIWAILKWRWFCIKKYEYLKSYRGQINNMESLSARDYADHITTWMAWWPMSLSWWLLHDPITRFYQFLHKKLSRLFDSISESAKSDVIKSE